MTSYIFTVEYFNSAENSKTVYFKLNWLKIAVKSINCNMNVLVPYLAFPLVLPCLLMFWSLLMNVITDGMYILDCSGDLKTDPSKSENGTFWRVDLEWFSFQRSGIVTIDSGFLSGFRMLSENQTIWPFKIPTSSVFGSPLVQFGCPIFRASLCTCA